GRSSSQSFIYLHESYSALFHCGSVLPQAKIITIANHIRYVFSLFPYPYMWQTYFFTTVNAESPAQPFNPLVLTKCFLITPFLSLVLWNALILPFLLRLYSM